MEVGVLSMRYAKALLAYADEKGTEDTVYPEYRHWIILYCLLKQS